MNMKLGFIGGGNMGGAIIGGIVNARIAAPSNILVSDANPSALAKISAEYGVNTTNDNKETAEKSDILFLCVKPQFVYFVINEIKDSVSENTVIVSIVAGQSIEALT
ncbi:MAG: NAD(P)-binding domain-containing protein, partial [Oscillospiraceae bacterium]|nr:NAD(P)-binding domain-containing protein [Oscillospiraceae bacterium]